MEEEVQCVVICNVYQAYFDEYAPLEGVKA